MTIPGVNFPLVPFSASLWSTGTSCFGKELHGWYFVFQWTKDSLLLGTVDNQYNLELHIFLQDQHSQDNISIVIADLGYASFELVWFCFLLLNPIWADRIYELASTFKL